MQTSPFDLDALSRLLLSDLKDRLRLATDEHIGIRVRDGSRFLETATDTFAIGLEYWKVELAGRDSPGARSYRAHSVDLKLGQLMCSVWLRERVVEAVRDALWYLGGILVPWRKPKGYRMLSKRVVLAPVPRHRSRLRLR